MTRAGRALGPGRLYVTGKSWVLDFKDGAGRRRRQVLSTDKRVAERLRAEIINQRDLELAGLSSVEGQSLPLASVRAAFLADLKTRVCAPYHANSTSILTRMLENLEATRVRDLRLHEVLRVRAKLVESGLAPRTVNIHIDRLRGMLNWAVAGNLIAENPLKGLKRLPDGEAQQSFHRRALSELEITAFLEAAEADDRDRARRAASDHEAGFRRT